MANRYRWSVVGILCSAMLALSTACVPGSPSVSVQAQPASSPTAADAGMPAAVSHIAPPTSPLPVSSITAPIAAAAPSATPGDPVVEIARGILGKMTVEQKVGQVYMLGFDGTTLNAGNRALILGLHLGGVTLFARNVENPAQVAELVHNLQSVANPVPLFVSVDQEGGTVLRFTSGSTMWPGAMALGATGDPSLARQMAEASSQEMLAMGVNMDLAPVVDVNTNPVNPVIGVRSYGSDVNSVSQFGVATIQGLQSSGVSAVAKHFPGHGDTAVDSHKDLPVVPYSLDHLDAVELPPFRAAIDAGVDSIMVAHLYLPKVEPDPDVPADLSHTVMADLLRNRLGFQGLIQTDALDMEAIKHYRTAAEASVMAFEAGADQLLIAGITAEDRILLADGPKALLAAVRSGRVSEARLDESVLRILETKIRRGIIPSALYHLPTAGLQTVASPEHQALALDIARKATTLVRDHTRMLPLNPSKRILVVIPQETPHNAAEDQGVIADLAAAVRQYAPATQEWWVEYSPSISTLSQAAWRARAADVVVLATYDALQVPAQADLATALQASGRPVVAVALRGPYDASAMPGVSTFLAAYGDLPVNVQAAAEALFGRLTPSGKLPVPLP